MAEKKSRKKLGQQLLHKYKLIVLNEDTLMEQTSFRLNLMNILVALGILAIVVSLFTALLILYTPISKLLLTDNGTGIENKRKVVQLAEQVENLEQKLQSYKQYDESLRQIITGKSPKPVLDTTLKQFTPNDSSNIILTASDNEKELRDLVEKESRKNYQSTSGSKSTLLFPPIKGNISMGYNISENHLAVDIPAKKGEAVKAVADGIILFTDWTPETGNVVILKHADNDWISVYKHNSVVYKNQGDWVDRGEAIAAVGNTGEFSTGPHLHFELWINGKAVNPETYIDF